MGYLPPHPGPPTRLIYDLHADSVLGLVGETYQQTDHSKTVS